MMNTLCIRVTENVTFISTELSLYIFGVDTSSLILLFWISGGVSSGV